MRFLGLLPLDVSGRKLFCFLLLRPSIGLTLLFCRPHISSFLRISVFLLQVFSLQRVRRLALFLCYWPPWLSSVGQFLTPGRLLGSVMTVSPSIGSLQLSMSKFSFAIIAKWNWSIQLFHWVGGSTVWFGQKAGIPRRFESVVDCAIIKS